MVGIQQHMAAAAAVHQQGLTKPQGSLGRLEDLACWFAARQGKLIPDPLKASISIFAADHGVAAEGVSAFPSVVTAEMVKNFAAGGAAINVLARQAKADLHIIDVGVLSDVSAIQSLEHCKVRPATGNITHEDAMTEAECEQALAVGARQAEAAIEQGANLLIAGDMGIANTTSSAVLICALTGHQPEQVVGRGTGIDDAVYQHKLAIVAQCLERAKGLQEKALLCAVGGLEIAAMAGFYLRAAQLGVPVLLDGFISTAAALLAVSLEADCRSWMLASHVSQESGHVLALQALGLEPLLDFSLRLGEASGAALVLPLLQSALALHAEMASFTQAGVSTA